MNLFNRIKDSLNKTSFIVFVIASVVLIFLISIVVNSFVSDSETEESESQEIDFVTQPIPTKNNLIEQEDIVLQRDYPSSSILLEQLPYYSDTFEVNYLPLEKGVIPQIFVTIKTINGSNNFREWLSQFEFDESEINLEFIEEDRIFHGPYNE